MIPFTEVMYRFALSALKKFNLHKILLCPAFFAPLREQKPLFSPKDRLAMVSAVTQEHSQLEMFDHEIISGKTSYTYNTLQRVHEIYPKDEIFLMLGDDQFNSLNIGSSIRKSSKILTYCFNRINSEKSKTFFERFPSAKIFALGNQLLPFSSTEIRKNIETGRDISHLVPSSVFSYMQKNQLFDLNTL